MSIRIMMREIKTNALRVDRNGWKQKFHDLLHMLRDLDNFGSPNNFDAAPNENNLIDFAKNQAGGHIRNEKYLFLKSVSI